MSIDAGKFEDGLIEQVNKLSDVFNEVYTGRNLIGNEAVKAYVLEAKIDTLRTVLKALRESVK